MEYPYTLLKELFGEGIAFGIMQSRPKEIIELDIQYALRLLSSNEDNKVDDGKIELFNMYWEDDMSPAEIEKCTGVDGKSLLYTMSNIRWLLKRRNLINIIKDGVEKFYMIQGALLNGVCYTDEQYDLDKLFHSDEGLQYLGLSTRAYNCLRRHGMTWKDNRPSNSMSPAKLVFMSDKEIRKIRNCGEVTALEIMEIREKLKKGNFTFCDGDIEWTTEE